MSDAVWVHSSIYTAGDLWNNSVGYPICADGLLVNGIIIGDGANQPGGSGGAWLTYTPIEEVMNLIGGGPALH